MSFTSQVSYNRLLIVTRGYEPAQEKYVIPQKDKSLKSFMRNLKLTLLTLI